MANTNTRTLVTSGQVSTIYFTMTSDGTEETDYKLWDASADSDNPVVITGTKIMRIMGCVSGDPVVTRVKLEYDADTDVHAVSLPVQQAFDLDYREMGGLHDRSGTGATGDIFLTTLGLASGDSMHLVLVVKTR